MLRNILRKHPHITRAVLITAAVLIVCYLFLVLCPSLIGRLSLPQAQNPLEPLIGANDSVVRVMLHHGLPDRVTRDDCFGTLLFQYTDQSIAGRTAAIDYRFSAYGWMGGLYEIQYHFEKDSAFYPDMRRQLSEALSEQFSKGANTYTYDTGACSESISLRDGGVEIAYCY
ncbi:MAG: hypothetical protein IJU16_02160 [Clostridia bacterium]|nr:hypothetical protein [Clostridia bacterium]